MPSKLVTATALVAVVSLSYLWSVSAENTESQNNVAATIDPDLNDGSFYQWVWPLGEDGCLVAEYSPGARYLDLRHTPLDLNAPVSHAGVELPFSLTEIELRGDSHTLILTSTELSDNLGQISTALGLVKFDFPLAKDTKVLTPYTSTPGKGAGFEPPTPDNN